MEWQRQDGEEGTAGGYACDVAWEGKTSRTPSLTENKRKKCTGVKGFAGT